MATNVQYTDQRDSDQKTQRKRHQLRGGFECIFVKDPPEHLQTECSVCLCVLREPYLLDCCGYSFCKSCIEPIKSEKKPCPLCAVHFTTCIPDKRLQRTLNDFQVYCSHKEEGCKWAGQLANLAHHLNVNPLFEAERLSGCQLTSFDCKHCGECFQRRELVNHETSVCSKRPYSCEYCRDFKSTFEDVTSNHLSVCPGRPVPCYNGCGSSPLLKSLEDHLKECPLEVIECAFSYAGCNEKLPRKDMAEHITQRLAIHMSLQATSHRQEVVKLNQRISELEERYEQSRAEVAKLRIANQNLVAVGREAQEKVRTITKEVKSVTTALHSHVGLVPFKVTVTGFRRKKRSNEQWYSPPFYSHPRGYKMCLNVDVNGFGDGENSHVSVFVQMMRGEYDDFLKWPFRGAVTIQLVNRQRFQVGRYVKIVDVTDDDDFGDRVLVGEQSDEGLGNHKFISHRDLTRYLKDDCLMFCVKGVEVMSV